MHIKLITSNSNIPLTQTPSGPKVFELERFHCIMEPYSECKCPDLGSGLIPGGWEVLFRDVFISVGWNRGGFTLCNCAEVC